MMDFFAEAGQYTRECSYSEYIFRAKEKANINSRCEYLSLLGKLGKSVACVQEWTAKYYQGKGKVKTAI